MPPPAQVSNADVIASIARHVQHFETNDFPIFSHSIWTTISNELEKKWKPCTVYNHIGGNKNNNLQQARQNLNISTPPPSSKMPIIEEDNCTYDPPSEDSGDDSDWSNNEKENSALGIDSFPLHLTKHEYDQIKPTEGSGSSSTRLKKKAWAPVISRALHRKYKLPCGFFAKNSHIRLDKQVDDDNDFLKFRGYCGSKKCNNTMVGIAHEIPNDNGLSLIVYTRDTHDDKECHEDVKRPLNGPKRKEVGRILRDQKAANYREKLVQENMEFGDTEPFFIRSNNVYRQAKMENLKEELGLELREKVDVIKSLVKLAENPQYTQSIHRLDAIEFACWYCTPEQIHVYKEYCRLQKECSQIAIDASGKFVRKFPIVGTKQTGNIFLYTITINFERTTISVNQMLSTIQTQEFIEDWMKHWKRLKAPSSRECISEYERAIPLSAALAFNNMSLKSYVDECFLWANLNSEEKLRRPRPATTLILIDVAHVMSFVAKWKSLRDCHPAVKGFYLRCLALLIDAQSLQKFQRIFSLVCIVALQPFNDATVCTSKENITVEEARLELEDFISTKSHVIEDLETSRDLFEKKEDKNLEKEFIEGENDTLTHRWIKKLIAAAKPPDPSSVLGKSVNAFYSPDFINALERIAKEFPLWTAAAIPHRGGHASTAYQEAYFARLRSHVFDRISLPCETNLFIKTHIDHLQSNNKMLSSKLTHFVHRSAEADVAAAPDIPGTEAQNSRSSSAQQDVNLRAEGSSVSVPIKMDVLPSGHTYKPKKRLASSASAKSESSGSNKAEQVSLKCPASSSHQSAVPQKFRAPEMRQAAETKKVKAEFSTEPRRVFNADDSDLKSSVQWKGLKNNKIFINDTSSDENDDSMSHLLTAVGKVPKGTSGPFESPPIVSSDVTHKTSEIPEKNKVNESSDVPSNIPDDKVHSTFFEPVDFSYDSRDPPFHSTLLPDNSSDNMIAPDNNVIAPDDNTISLDNNVTAPDGNMIAPDDNMSTPDNVIGPGDNLIAPNDFLSPGSEYPETLKTEIDGLSIATHVTTEIQAQDGDRILKEFRTKMQKNHRLKAQGHYFQTYPEIKVLNRRGFTRKKGFFLRNGLQLHPVVTPDGIKVQVINSCGVDSIVHVLQFAALDCNNYSSFIQSSNQNTLKFVHVFKEERANSKLYAERLRILRRYYPITRNAAVTSLSPWYLDASDFITKIWTELMQPEVSAVITKTCTNCPPKKRDVGFFVVNERPIKENGFKALQQALQFRDFVRNKSCGEEGCTGTVEERTACNKHVFIDVDIRSKVIIRGQRKVMEIPLQSPLESFPETLQLDRRFRLAGVIDFSAGHFIAYCLRTTGTWLECNNLADGIKTVLGTKEIIPHGVIYVED